MNLKTNCLYRVVIGMLLLLLAGCNSEETRSTPNVSNIDIMLRVIHLDDSLRTLDSEQDLLDFIERHHGVRYLFRPFHGRYHELYEAISTYKGHTHNDTLKADVQSIFGNFSEQEEELRKAFQYVKYYFPSHETPTIYTVLSGFGSYGFGGDLLSYPKSVFIGLDYFGGETMSYRPPEVPQYLLKRYSPEYLTSSVMKIISQDFIHNDSDKSLLADMIFYGKALYFTKSMLPNTPDSVIMGFSDLELKQAEFNEARIWTHFVNNDLFYQVSDRIKSKYVGERPKTSEISPDAPGRIGRWLGWQIVKSYAAKHPDKSLGEILEASNSREFFQHSGYKPKAK